MDHLLLLTLLACDPETADCTLIGCADELILHVIGPDDTSEVSGRVTVGGHDFMVDCDGTSDPEVTCVGSDLVFQLSEGLDRGEVAWGLSSSGRDSGGGGGGYAGEGTVLPEWNSSQPNGPDCPPTCTSGEATVELLGTP